MATPGRAGNNSRGGRWSPATHPRRAHEQEEDDDYGALMIWMPFTGARTLMFVLVPGVAVIVKPVPLILNFT